ncbi:MAG: relaxase domain-containing protein [Betaproteobacteria bacterium]|nr:relaxase domain-containing protein [Betaproteobacteria bacterium]
MISRSIITNPRDAAGYYTDQAAAAEYYSGEAVPSAWTGAAAEAMGLTGKVDAAALTNILQGRIIEVDPATGEPRERQLGRIGKDGQPQHRAGYDFTISAPKSVSLEALVHGNPAALEAHRRAVAAAIAYLEEHGALARVGGKHVKTDGLAIATFEHVSSRARDPQLHTHALFANLTFLGDKAYSLSSEKLFEHRSAADAVYQNTLSYELQRAGFEVQHDRAGHVEIAGYTRADLEDFSKRKAEIDATLAERGAEREGSSATSRMAAALATRSTKDLPEVREAHLERWQAQADAMGIKPAEQSTQLAKQAKAIDPAAIAREAVQQAVAHLTEREAVFQLHDLNHQAARFSAGKASWTQIAAEIKAQTKSGELIRNGDRFTTRSAQDLERDSARRLQQGKGAHEAILTPREFDDALAKFEKQKALELKAERFALTAEQRAAASMILTGDDRFQGVQGLAGTGKTTMLEFVCTAAESKGWTVTGHSNGSEQAAKLQAESGIASTTTARHLIDAEQALRGQPTTAQPPHVKELRIMDEASMAGQREFAKVLRTTEAAGARTVFLGDKLQHQSVESGKAFEQAQQHMPTRELGEKSIRRQRTEHMQDAVKDILARRHDDAIKRLEVKEIAPAQAALQDGATRDQKREAAKFDNAAVIKQLAADYVSLPPDARANTLIVTATNADRQAINSAIRAELKARGELGAGAQMQTLRKADLTSAEGKRAGNYTPGQILETSTKTQHHERGERFEVLKTDSRTNTLRVRRTSDGREQLIDPARIKVVAYSAEVREFAAGDRIKFTENHKLPSGEAVRNGQFARIEAVTDKAMVLRLGEGDKAQRIEVSKSSALKAEHAYASTSHAAQGQTVDKVMIHHNTAGGRHGDREAYVNVTRGRDDAVIYTQNAELAGKQAGAELNKTAALDLTPEQPTPPKPPTDDRKPKRETLTRASTDRAILQAQAELEQKQKKIGNATL